jgi:hypothetical protein
MSDAVFVLNANSSSLKFSVYGMADRDLSVVARGKTEVVHGELTFSDPMLIDAAVMTTREHITPLPAARARWRTRAPAGAPPLTLPSGSCRPPRPHRSTSPCGQVAYETNRRNGRLWHDPCFRAALNFTAVSRLAVNYGVIAGVSRHDRASARRR